MAAPAPGAVATALLDQGSFHIPKEVGMALCRGYLKLDRHVATLKSATLLAYIVMTHSNTLVQGSEAGRSLFNAEQEKCKIARDLEK